MAVTCYYASLRPCQQPIGDEGKNCCSCYLFIYLKFQVEKVSRREEDYQSDRECSATPGEEMASSPLGQYNGSYTTLNMEDADGVKR